MLKNCVTRNTLFVIKRKQSRQLIMCLVPFIENKTDAVRLFMIKPIMAIVPPNTPLNQQLILRSISFCSSVTSKTCSLQIKSIDVLQNILLCSFFKSSNAKHQIIVNQNHQILSSLSFSAKYGSLFGTKRSKLYNTMLNNDIVPLSLIKYEFVLLTLSISNTILIVKENV